MASVGNSPLVDPTAWVAPGATVVGAVRLGPGSSVWFSAVLRSDLETITVGAESNVQDGCVLHADPGFPVVVGDGVSVGHGAVLHGCAIGDNTLVGMGAILLNGARVGPDAVIAAGSVVPPGASIPGGTLAMGSPARVRRETTPAERDATARNARHYVELMRQYRARESPPG